MEVLESDRRVKDTETRVMRVVASARMDVVASALMFGVDLPAVAQAPALAASPAPCTPPSASEPPSSHAVAQPLGREVLSLLAVLVQKYKY